MEATAIQTLAAHVTSILATALSAAGGDGGAAGATGAELAVLLGRVVGGKAAALMHIVAAKFNSSPAAEEALIDLAQTPVDADAQATLRHMLKKTLQADDQFAQELAAVFKQDEAQAAAGSTTIVSVS